jgi:hypothetical protein
MKKLICGVGIAIAVAQAVSNLDAQCNLKQTVRFDRDLDNCHPEGAPCVVIIYEPTCERCRLVDVTKNTNCTENEPYAATSQIWSGVCFGAGTSQLSCFQTAPAGDPHPADCFHTTTTDCGA